MVATKLNKRSIDNFGLLLLAMLILLVFLVFIDSFSFNSKNTDKTLSCSHDDLFVRARIVHESNWLRRDLSCSIKVGSKLSSFKFVLLVNILSNCDVVVLSRFTLKINLRHLSAIPLNQSIFERNNKMLLSQQKT